MYKGKKILGLIPARGGSKGLPGKNIKPLCGKPLIAWAIEQGLASKYLDKVIVSTDDEEIAKVSRSFGAEVPFMRPGELATDAAKTIDVVVHALEFLKQRGGLEFDYLALLEPTSPLRKNGDIDKSIARTRAPII
ncbi:acylneuraminate cytidylyltransferase family protein [Syntrophaceticus schinkii]|uniref:N-acylneuraminate cytidylyltransferase n=1 Tax=Syntrophaceticus schinkii TaxID=499207 RepID=A0A0B7MDX7_9FIRM